MQLYKHEFCNSKS